MYKVQLIPKKEIKSVLPLVKLLNENKSEELLLLRLNEMLERGYQCAGIYHNEKLVGVCGIWILTKLYVGRHIEPDNVVMDPEYRDKGPGESLMKWVEDYARSQGCEALELNCYIQNAKGQKFWENLDYKVLGMHYQKKL